MPVRLRKAVNEIGTPPWLRDVNALLQSGISPMGAYTMGMLSTVEIEGGADPTFAQLKRASEVKNWEEFKAWERAMLAGQIWT